MLGRFVFFHCSAAEDGEKMGPAKNNKQEKMSRWELERKIGNTKTKQQTEGEMLKNTCQCFWGEHERRSNIAPSRLNQVDDCANRRKDYSAERLFRGIVG